ncbi:MAG TPA: SRPBCC family protein [Candidatus Limnocylindrales bacterium]|nr:SRPBCC family protein [Candidatus Limnocylindrales bacterium]
MIDILNEVDAIQRDVGTGKLAAGEAKVIRLRRTYDAPIDDVWDALTNPERIGRWFLPISGDYRLGGRYQFEGNAGGEILECSRPNRLKVTWVYGETPEPGAASEVEVRLAPAGDKATTLEFEHTAIVPEDMWSVYGPGAVGVGWDGGLLGLGLHLRGGSVGDSEAWQVSPEGRDFYTQSSKAWGEASRAAGVDDETVATYVANTTQFYAPDPGATS